MMSKMLVSNSLIRPIKILSSLFFVFVAGCTTIAPPSAPPTQLSWQNREALLARVQSWQIKGKIAVQTAQDAGSATIQWAQNHQQFTLSLLGPLGTHGVTLTGQQPGRVTMETANGKQFSAASPEQLLSEQWGWNLPVSYLKYWIRGLPTPQTPVTTSHFDTYHRLTDLVQQNWHVEFVSYTNKDGVELPQKIYITSASLKTKIVIYEWNITFTH
jgi:outer membrane lipoprotein LolB